MSLIVAHIGPESALVGVDSIGLDVGTGVSGEICKLHVVAHLGAVLAFRGSATFGAAVAAQLAAVPDAGEDLPRRLDAILPVILAQLHKALPEADWPRLGPQEVLMVQWNGTMPQPVGTVWQSTGGAFARSEAGEYVIAPWVDGLRECKAPSTPEYMAVIAKRQVQWIAKNKPEVAAGGRLLCAEVTRSGILLFAACHLPETRPAAG